MTFLLTVTHYISFACFVLLFPNVFYFFVSFVFFKVVGYGGNLKKGRRKKCHWCQRSESWSLIKCSTCQKEFFCMDCIKERLELVLFTLSMNFSHCDIIICCAYMVNLLLHYQHYRLSYILENAEA